MHWNELVGCYYKFSCFDTISNGGWGIENGEIININDKFHNVYKEIKDSTYMQGDYVLSRKYKFKFHSLGGPLLVNKLSLVDKQPDQDKIVLTTYKELNKWSRK